MSYETYIYETADGRVPEAVIAYRGTENYELKESVWDWMANLSAAADKDPKEYAIARDRLPGLIAGLKAAFPGVRIYATGHSLGGGLAQQAGYVSKDIEQVYAFDPSPVTNWKHLSEKNLVANPNPAVFRVYHWHEALAVVRKATALFTPPRPGRSDYEFFYEDLPPVKAHDMGVLACHFARDIEGAEADHHYTKEQALKLTSPLYDGGKHAICPGDIRTAQGE